MVEGGKDWEGRRRIGEGEQYWRRVPNEDWK